MVVKVAGNLGLEDLEGWDYDGDGWKLRNFEVKWREWSLKNDL
jgi:hypothetical protein